MQEIESPLSPKSVKDWKSIIARIFVLQIFIYHFSDWTNKLNIIKPNLTSLNPIEPIITSTYTSNIFFQNLQWTKICPDEYPSGYGFANMKICTVIGIFMSNM